MKAKLKRVIVLEIDYESDEFEVIRKLLAIGKSCMINHLKFTEEQFKTSGEIYEKFHKLIKEIGG